MADAGLFAQLQSSYPNISSVSVIRIMKRCDNDKKKCLIALDEEQKLLHPDPGIVSSLATQEGANYSNNNLISPSENKSITARIKELQVSHEAGFHSRPSTAEQRHISTIERSLIRNNDPKRSINVTISHQGDRPINPPTTAQPNRTFTGSNIAPQTAPADFTPFMFNRSPSDVPNIDCRAGRSRQVPVNSSTNNSPVEQRRPVKVINIPPGSFSGGSVSPAATQPNHRQIRMHFGDTGGVCTVSTPPLTMHHQYGSTPNISQHYRSEFRTETSSAQPVHSSSILLNTSSHGNHFTIERKNNSHSEPQAESDRRTPVPPLSISASDLQASPGSSNMFQASRPLSTPVQATSPGIAHSKPVFVEIKREPFVANNYPDNFSAGIFPNQTRTVPSYNTTGFVNYNQLSADFQIPSPEQVNKGPGYSSPPTNVYQQGYTYGPYGHSPFDQQGYPGTPLSHHSSQPPNHLSQYTHFPSSSGSLLLVTSRSSSQESEHSAASDYDNRGHAYNNVTSHGNITPEMVPNRAIRSRSGSLQEEAEYIQALLQHQKSRKMKLEDDIEKNNLILEQLRSEVGNMEKSMIENSSLNKSFPSFEDISKLCESNRLLQTDIQMYMNEIEMYKSGQIPFSKINPIDQQNFFANMPTGQQDPIYNRTLAHNKIGERRPAPLPPPRPPPPIPLRQPSTELSQPVVVGHADIFRVPPVPPNQQPSINSGDSEEGDSWNCSYCTFSNHPAMKKCEVCEMPRMTAESPVGCPPIPPHQPLLPLPPRLAPSASLGHHHRAGT